MQIIYWKKKETNRERPMWTAVQQRSAVLTHRYEGNLEFRFTKFIYLSNKERDRPKDTSVC